MALRRRIALWLDPSLTPQPEEPARLDIGLGWGHYYDLARNTERIAVAIERIEHRTKPRKGRTILCNHPELHPEIEKVPS